MAESELRQEVMNQDSGVKMQADESQSNKNRDMTNDVSVTQLDSIKPAPRFGGPPLYEQLVQNKLEYNRQNFNPEEEDFVCGRFPHVTTCACDTPWREAKNLI